MRNVIFKNGSLLEACLSTKELLSQYPQGVYTTARTIGRNNIVEFRSHLERLEKIFELTPQISKEIDVCHTILPTLKHSMKHFLEKYPETKELRITMLVHPNNSNFDVLALTEELPPPPSPPIKVEIRRWKRSTPTIKSSQWVIDRKHLEEAKSPDANEVIMQDFSDYTLGEGLSSNFYALKDGKLQLAPDFAILSGTTLSLVLESCGDLNLPVLREFPDVREIDSWEGCFLSSTSRLVLPIDEIHIVETNERKKVKLSPMVEKIKKLVAQKLQKRSTPVLDQCTFFWDYKDDLDP